MSWSRSFDEPIPLHDGRKLVTLRDAGRSVAGLPKSTQQKPEWQLAAEMLLNAAERGGTVMLVEIAMRRALFGKPKGPPPAPRRKRAKVYKVVR